MQKLIQATCAIAEKDAVLLALRGLLRLFTGIQKEPRRSVIALIKTRLIRLMGKNKKYIAQNVIFQWLKLAANVVLIWSLAKIFDLLFGGSFRSFGQILPMLLAVVGCVAVRFVCTSLASNAAHGASAQVKKVLRGEIYRKIVRLGADYHEKVSTAQVLQIFVEGVDQLETYFGRYLPQFFYAMLAPLTLCIVVSVTASVKAGVILFVCVFLIPATIMVVQKIAKKLLSKYWGKYTQLGDTFLENVQGLTTLKIYGSDEAKHRDMNEKAEEFRRITMKVLTMQLNSIIIMDVIAYGGSALGVIIAVSQVLSSNIEPWQAFFIIMLSADFFLPMRALGSFFHVAMNGMAASDRMFELLDLPEDADGAETPDNTNLSIHANGVTFSYDGTRNALDGFSAEIPQGSFTAVVGASGCGKSTLASLLCGVKNGYSGSLSIGGKEVASLSRDSLNDSITAVGAGSFIFAGTVRDNLLPASPGATDDEMVRALKKVRLWEFLYSQQGLDTEIKTEGSNLSGGQRQRLALARAILHDTPIYIFDEATSNIDVESERDILDVIRSFAGEKTVIMITHRLENAVFADQVLVLAHGQTVQTGTHETLKETDGVYRTLYEAQKTFEQYAKNGEEIA